MIYKIKYIIQRSYNKIFKNLKKQNGNGNILSLTWQLKSPFDLSPGQNFHFTGPQPFGSSLWRQPHGCKDFAIILDKGISDERDVYVFQNHI